MKVWVAFVLSIASIFIISRRSFPLALVVGGLILGLLTITPMKVCTQVVDTITNVDILLLAIAVSVIPLIGGIMEYSGELDLLLNNLRIGKRGLLILVPALVGMLPMPGGALLSAPMVQKVASEEGGELKTAINIWFRHLLILIYPLSAALIAATKIVGFTVYDVLPYLLMWFVLAFVLGYLFFLFKISGKIAHKSDFSLRGLLIPISILMVAPVIDFAIQRAFSLKYKSVSTLIGVSMSLILAVRLSPKRIHYRKIITKMRPWEFGAIILGMFIFFNIFKVSPIADRIAGIEVSPITLSIWGGFLLGFATGRVQLPASIILPIYLTKSGNMSGFMFSLIYVSIFFGYVISPVHPCVAITVSYFKTSMMGFIKKCILPVAIIMLIVVTLTYIR